MGFEGKDIASFESNEYPKDLTHYFYCFQLRKAQSDEKKSSNQLDKSTPYLANLNEDPMLSYIIFHHLNTDEITIGSRNAMISLNGLSILERHAFIRRLDANRYELRAAEAGAKIKINGYNLNGYENPFLSFDIHFFVYSTIQLRHKDRILFGASHVYVYLNPLYENECAQDLPAVITWEFAQKEIAKAKGYSMGNNLTMEQEEIQEKILSLLPLLSEINAISEELNKYRVFEIVLMPVSSWDGVAVKGSK